MNIGYFLFEKGKPGKYVQTLNSVKDYLIGTCVYSNNVQLWYKIVESLNGGHSWHNVDVPLVPKQYQAMVLLLEG